MRECGHCSTSIEGKRKDARYCSKSCRNMASRARTESAIPAVLRGEDRWVRWKYVQRGSRRTKVPTNTLGRYASSTDPRTWTSFAGVNASRHGAGVGFVLGGGFACIDLDHCLMDGVISEGARRVLDAVGPTYVEVSPSGDGLHVWVRSGEARGRVLDVDGQPVEVYSMGRYMTVTGDVFDGSVSRIARVEDIARLVESLV